MQLRVLKRHYNRAGHSVYRYTQRMTAKIRTKNNIGVLYNEEQKTISVQSFSLMKSLNFSTFHSWNWEFFPSFYGSPEGSSIAILNFIYFHSIFAYFHSINYSPFWVCTFHSNPISLPVSITHALSFFRMGFIRIYHMVTYARLIHAYVWNVLATPRGTLSAI